ncbi:MAG: transglutaminase-like domain-containing protein [Candidatus Melainabacteria bacterium]|nr:transglutaminase-like domain-containing protein [Candidatus Melainabacteria bacterium]
MVVEEKVKLSDKDLQGFVSLLRDSTDSTLNLMGQQISKLDDHSLENIEEIVSQNEDEALIDNWYQASKVALQNQIQDWKRDGDLEQGLFLISRLRNPGLNITKYQEQLDDYARRVAEKLKANSSVNKIIFTINQVLFREEGFRGNQDDYYDLDNNFLHSVLDTKHGNPIMLSSIYILLGRRLGLDIKSIGTPGHFIVQFDDQFIDPFFQGKRITRQECVLRAQELSVYWRDEFLEPTDDRFIISRCIRNIIAIYKKQNEFDKAADATNLLKLV